MLFTYFPLEKEIGNIVRQHCLTTRPLTVFLDNTA